MQITKSDFERAVAVGRPPNIAKLFPNSRALIVSGKVIDRAMMAKGHAIAIAASVRNSFVAHGALRAAARANAAIIIEIAKSEGGSGRCPATSAYGTWHVWWMQYAMNTE